jgi:Ca2+-transporting ATPase
MQRLEAANPAEHWAGLSEREASERRRTDGPNELPADRKRGWLRILADVLREPMLGLLVLCGAIYVILGDRGEAAMLSAFVAVIIAISVLQAQKAERTLDELRRLSAAQAIVIRSGRQQRIQARNVVRGDLVVLIEGDRVPADVVLISGRNVSVDESLLTGESAPVRKSIVIAVPDVMGKPGGNDLPFVYSGTMIVQGKGLGRVLAIGKETEIGRIGRALTGIVPEPARAQVETTRIVRCLAIAAALLSLTVTLIYGYQRGSWLQAALVGIAFAMAIMPEELPVVLSAFFGLGSWRIARNGVLTRYLPAIETLGATTVLCVDKTGTITANQMRVAALSSPDGATWFSGVEPLPDAFHEILEFGVLASHRDPFDPTERAIAQALDSFLADTEHVHRDWVLGGEYPLSREMLAMSRAWSSAAGGDERVIAAKGAPEAISDLCHLSADQRTAVAAAVDSFASRGLRVLGVARAPYGSAALPSSQHEFDFKFIGLVALEDPIRRGVSDAVREAYAAGIRTIIITGDYPSTAISVAREIGLANAERYITGAQLEDMSESELSEHIKVTNVFCRVVPEQKLRIVQALKRDGEIVAMTGDGVNDAPALKAAHVGIAMGARGTDVAREAAALVLLNDDFTSILEAVKQGRRIYDNLRKAITFVTAAHVPIVGMSIIPVLFGMPLLLLPIHILFLQLIIDPACSIAFEAEPPEPDVMKRPPRDVDSRLFDRATIMPAAVQGLIILLTVISIFVLALGFGREEATARAMAFTTMVLCSLALLFVNRFADQTPGPNRIMLIITTGAVIVLALGVSIPALQSLFRFGAMGSFGVSVVASAAALCFGALLLSRMLSRSIAKRSRTFRRTSM